MIVRVLTTEGRRQAMRLDALRPAKTRRHVALPSHIQQLAQDVWRRVGRCIFGPTGEAEWLDNFLFDANPKNEVFTWWTIAEVVDRLWGPPISKGLSRGELAGAVTAVSFGMVDVPAHVPNATDALILKIRRELDAAEQRLTDAGRAGDRASVMQTLFPAARC
jgi:hypothetical protein